MSLFEDENGVSWPNEFQSWWDKFSGGFCGCGDPTEMVLLIKKTLEERRLKDNLDLPRIEDDPYKLFFYYWLDSKGLMEHGTSISYPWTNEAKFPKQLKRSDQEIRELMAQGFE